MKHRKLNRRELGLTLLAGTAAAAAAQPQTAPNAVTPNTSVPNPDALPPETAPFQQSLSFTRHPVPKKIESFPMQNVRITAGPCNESQDLNLAYLKRLDTDRLVHNFRVNAVLPSSAKPYGGWEAPDCEVRGHFTGHFLSACALMYSSTGSTEMKAKGDAVVVALAECQAKLGGGYLSAFPSSYLDRLKTHQKIWAPFYTYHKILAGMLDMSTHCGNQQALDVAKGMAHWTDTWSAPVPEAQMQQILEVEYGGMNEALYNLATLTGDDHYVTIGDRFTKKRFFNPLALRRDELRGLHVNTHIPQVIGAARRYELSGDQRFHDVADFFWYEVTSARAYVTGGTSNNEHWLVEPRHLAAELKMGSDTTECCCAYNMLKLTRTLYEWTGDPRYFDYYERTLLNHRLGTVQPETGHTQYYLSIVPGAWRTFNTEDHSFWCCTGTGVEEYSKLNDSIYFHDDSGVYVNLFIASELTWKEKALTLRQETRFPEVSATKLIIASAPASPLSIHLRIPTWAGPDLTVKLNGKPVEALASPGSYLTIHRAWTNGDQLELDMPMHLHLVPMPDEPSTQAILFGPIVLAGNLGENNIESSKVNGPEGPKLKDAQLEVPAFRAVSESPASWIKPGEKALTFHTTDQPRNIPLAPFYQTVSNRYSIYWTIS